MHKRILLVENSDTIRGAVEGLLRQNGYEVYSVPTAERALQVAKASRPNVMIVNSRATIPDGTPLYQLIASVPPKEAVPLLVITDQPSGALGVPLEIEVELPIDPKSFLNKVDMSIARDGAQVQSIEAAQTLGKVNANDDDLDHALGLDRIEVTDSEIMDKTAVGRRALRVVGETDDPPVEFDGDQTGQVGSIIITEDQSEIRINQDKPPPPPPTDSAALNILGDADQYAMDDPANLNLSGAEANHDYDWFVKEMQSDSKSQSVSNPPAGSSPLPPSPLPPQSVQETSIPEVPPVAQTEKPSSPSLRKDPPEIPPAGEHTGAVAQFIDEFKKEVEKFHDQEPESIVIKEDPPPVDAVMPPVRQWDETEETVTHQETEPFSQRFVADLAQRIAELIVAKINPDQLSSLIKEAVRSSRLKNNKN